MKRIIMVVVLIAATFYAARCQTKISEMPTLSGNPAGSFFPVIKSGINYKVDIANTGYSKVDSVRRKAGTDSVFSYSHGVKTFAYDSASVISSSSSNIILDSVVLSFDGLHPETSFATTETGFKTLSIEPEDEKASGFIQAFSDVEAVLQWQVAIKGQYKFYITYYY